jgi:hypothetical protein
MEAYRLLHNVELCISVCMYVLLYIYCTHRPACSNGMHRQSHVNVESCIHFMADQLLICCLPGMIGNPDQSCQVMATSQDTADFQDMDIGQNQGCLSGKGWYVMILLVTNIWLSGQNPF